MARKRYKSEDAKLRQVDVLVSRGQGMNGGATRGAEGSQSTT
jgi:hypothetical protein